MSETNYADLKKGKTSGDRTVMHVLYGLHTAAWFSVGTLAVIALIINYIKRGDELDAIYVCHHSYMIRTFWWTVLWLLLASPLWLFFILPGFFAYGLIWLWYLYRCIRGWLRFVDNKLA